MAWRWKTTQELPKSRRACTDEADKTMTKPTTTKALTSMASRTNSGVDRAFDAFWGPDRRRGVARRARSVAAGTHALPEQPVDGILEVLATLAIGAVPVERRASWRE